MTAGRSRSRAEVVSSGSGDERRDLGEQRGRCVPRSAADASPQARPIRTVTRSATDVSAGRQLRGPAVGGERGGRSAQHRLEDVTAAGPGGGRVGRRDPGQRVLPLPLERLGPPRPCVDLGELQAGGAVVGVAEHRLGPERRRPPGARPASRAWRAARCHRGPARSSRPASCRCRATSAARAAPWPGGAAGLDGERDGEMACRAGSLRSARAASASRAWRKRNPPGARPGQALCRASGDLGFVAVDRQGGDLRGRERPAPAGRDRLRQRPCRLRRAQRARPGRRRAGLRGGAQLPAARRGRSPRRAAGCPRLRADRVGRRPGRRGRRRRRCGRPRRVSGPRERAQLDLRDVREPAAGRGRRAARRIVGDRAGRSRRVSTNSTGIPASRRPMCAHRAMLARSARCTSSATSRTGRPDAAHSTSRSTASNTRSRSSSGAATEPAGRPCRPSARGEVGGESAELGRPVAAGSGGCGDDGGPARGRAPATSARRRLATDVHARRRPRPGRRRCRPAGPSRVTSRVLPIPASPVTTTTLSPGHGARPTRPRSARASSASPPEHRGHPERRRDGPLRAARSPGQHRAGAPARAPHRARCAADPDELAGGDASLRPDHPVAVEACESGRGGRARRAG